MPGRSQPTFASLPGDAGQYKAASWGVPLSWWPLMREALPDAIQQRRELERLPQKVLSAGQGRINVQALCRGGRDQDDRRRVALLAELSDQVEPAHSRHMHIGDEAIEAR